MDEVRMWAAAVCLTVLAAALLRMVCPEGNFSRLMRVILGAFVLCALIQPVSALAGADWGKVDSEPVMAQAESYAQQAQERSEEIMGSSLENLIRTELARAEIPVEKISVLVDTGEDESIRIKQIQICLSRKEDIERARTLLEESLEMETEVYAGEE